jgi:hypothetical protein
MEFYMGYLGDEFEPYLESMQEDGIWGDELTLVTGLTCTGWVASAHQRQQARQRRRGCTRFFM